MKNLVLLLFMIVAYNAMFAEKKSDRSPANAMPKEKCLFKEYKGKIVKECAIVMPK